MEVKTALEILIQSVQVANKRGVFELQESKLIAEAVELFTKKENDKEIKGTDTPTNKGGDTESN